MHRRLSVLALSALSALGLGSAAFAQGGPQCPNTCPATLSVAASGTIQPGDTITLMPLSVTDGEGAELGVVGGGTVCSTCESCNTDFIFSWRIQSSKCLSYNNCGLLQSGPGTGSLPGSLTRGCGKSRKLLISYGDCNPLYMGSCPPHPVDPVDYSATWTLDCATCQ